MKGRTFEIQRLIGRSLRAVADLWVLGPRTLRVDCDVVQADGGTRTAAITGAYLAVKDVMEPLLRSGVLSDNPLIDTLGAVSVGLVEGEILLDLDYQEDSRAGVDANFILTGSGQVVEVQAAAEAGPFSWEVFDAMAKLARDGVQEILQQVIGS